jgi:tRNA(Ile)-lysidine synthase
MNLDLEPGKYVAAVSGGVDSMALLHMLHEAAKQDQSIQVTVAHLDHGIRPDSRRDRELVEAAAASYGLPYIYEEVQLGPDASEATAREARYSFLREVSRKVGGGVIVTAHHQDDVLETMVLNLLRGTGRRGMASLVDRADIVRPLLNIPKTKLIAYARLHNLKWHEDSTNSDTTYLRNYIRHIIMPKFSNENRVAFLRINEQVKKINVELDALLQEKLDEQPEKQIIDRTWFCNLPYGVAQEVMAAWLRANSITNYDRNTINRLTVAAKVTHSGRQIDILEGRTMVVYRDSLALSNNER